MATATFVLMLACFAVALIAWGIGFAAYLRALRVLGRSDRGALWLALVAWPLATDRVRDRGLADATTVNKALVVLMAAIAVGCAFAALNANFSFLQSR